MTAAKKRKETAVDWLTRAGRLHVVDEYKALMMHLKANGSAERRALWDLLAAKRCFKRASCSAVLVRFGRRFEFPVFIEACNYCGKAPPEGAIEAGVIPLAHRIPQVKKWGRKLRHLVES